MVGENVAIVKDKAPDTTESGIILHKVSDKRSYATGIVASVGPRVTEDIKIGDRVIYNQHGQGHHSAGYTVLNFKEVYATIDHDEDVKWN